MPLITPPPVYRYGKRRSHRSSPTVSISGNPDSSESSQFEPTPLYSPATQPSTSSATTPGDLDFVLQPAPSHTVSPADSVSCQFIDDLKAFCESLRLRKASDASTSGSSSKRRPLTGTRNEWERALDELIKICGSLKASPRSLAMLESRLVLVAEELARKETLIGKIVAVQEDVMVCNITWESLKPAYIITTCGHTFSEDGLHMYFQNAIISELWRLKDLYCHVDIKGLTPNKFCPAFLVGLRERTRLFKPTYSCGTCRKAISNPPVQCSAFSNLTTKLQELLRVDGGEEELNEPPTCSMADYFIFSARHPF